jgi:hypothetical protein
VHLGGFSEEVGNTKERVMRVVCINNEYMCYDKSFICLKDMLTIHKIYDVIVDSSLTAPIYRRIFRIRCDDDIDRVYPEEVLMPIDIWREQQLNKIL